MGGQFIKCAVADFFEHLGQFAGDRGFARTTKHFSHINQTGGKTFGAFKENQTAGDRGKARQFLFTRHGFGRQEASIEEMVTGQARQDQGDNRGGSARCCGNVKAFGLTIAHKFIARIIDQRRARIGNKRQSLTLAKSVHDFRT